MLGRIGTMELLVVLGVAMVIFGPTQLPKLGRAMGDTIKSFKKGIEDETLESETSAENK